ncbi:MAG: DUF4912 domain-containing protein [Planctomycetales bacterium]|nr:DUF4912 domain-containing protein [Planctomycetales bacterium]
MARKNGISGWHAMRKEELIRALVQAAKRRSKSKASSTAASRRSAANGSANGSRSIRGASQQRNGSNGNVTSPHVRRRIDQLHNKLAKIKNLASPGSSDGDAERKDRLVVMVRDPYWLHAYWELSQATVDRAQAAMAQRWHAARPILRVFKTAEDGSATHLRDIDIHGGVSNWYVDVPDPPSGYRMEIGYAADDGFFYALARSNDVETPPAGTSDAVDENWSDVAGQADRIYAMSGGYSARGASRELQELLEERLRRPLGSPMKTRFGNGAAIHGQQLQFAVDAEIIVYGAADRDAHVTLQGEPVQLRDDGTFTVRLALPDRRQVLPIVASSGDGVEQRTIILAVERNTKVLEPVVRDVTDAN